MPRKARRYGSWDTRGVDGAVSGDDDVIGEPDGETGGDDGVGCVEEVICIYPYVPLVLIQLLLANADNGLSRN